MSESKLGGQFTFPDTSMTVQRIGYGAMQLAGPGVWGPPKDPDAAVAVLREAVAAGVNHIDTSDFYGPHVTNQIIRVRKRGRCEKGVGSLFCPCGTLTESPPLGKLTPRDPCDLGALFFKRPDGNRPRPCPFTDPIFSRSVHRKRERAEFSA